jgi:hypothetical protein
MLPLPVGREASSGFGAARYESQSPERTLLFQLVQEYYPAFKAHLAAEGMVLRGYVEAGYSGILPSALRASLRLFKIAPGDFVCPSCGARRMADECRDARGRAMQEQLPKVRLCWWTRFCPSSRCGKGC